MSEQDLYQTLGIEKNSSDADIKKAYRKLAMKYHPDRNPGDSASEQKFKSKESAVMDMFGSEQDIKVSGFDLRTFNDSEKLKMELESYGFYFSKHPIALMRKTLSSKLAAINKLSPSMEKAY